MADANYGVLDRLLHRLALQVRPVAELCFDLEQLLTRDTTSIAAERHVFVAGLARAGTTALMRRFHATNHYRSLTYRDMPFVLAPGLWRRISSVSERPSIDVERPHGDGVMVNVDSPEGLEEVFWRVFAGDEYLGERCLRPHEPGEAVLDRYLRYVRAIIASDHSRRRWYLSKNNNNILRLGAILRAFPNALVLIPFRDPFQQAMSLKRQHQRFCGLQRLSPFTRAYMNWLGHHEFGCDHRPFLVAGEALGRTPDALEYWLALWCEVYQWLQRTKPDAALFVCYEDLCAMEDYWPRLAMLAGLPAGGGAGERFQLRTRAVGEPVAPEIAERAVAIYTSLVKQARSQLAVMRQPPHAAPGGRVA